MSVATHSPTLPHPAVSGAPGKTWWQQVQPLAHAKVFKLDPEAKVDLEKEPDLPEGNRIEARWSDGTTLALLVTKTHPPQWASASPVADIAHELFVIHWNPEARLLFLSSSKRSETMYRHLVESVLVSAGGLAGSSLYRKLTLEELKRVFAGVHDFQFINVGMFREDAQKKGDEVYRIIAGHDLDANLDGKKPVRAGHAVGIGELDGERINFGISRGSKVWSTSHLSIRELATWCDELAQKIQRPKPKGLPRELADLV